MSKVEVSQQYKNKANEWGEYAMATTGELRAIIELLELVDIGDAASYLGEEAMVASEYSSGDIQEEHCGLITHGEQCGCTSCHILRS